MPSKLRKALGAVKDQTSISLAKVTNAANLEVTILKATTHDEIPMEERYVIDILQTVSSNKVYAAVCAHSIGKRIGKTRNWVVAIKSLMLVLRIFQDGDPYFPREVFHQMKKGAKILNLSSFRDDSNCPWDYTAFVRTFALYLDERLDCFLTGKLQRRFTYFNQTCDRHHRDKRFMEPGIKDMKPSMLLDRISNWQRLLDRAIGTRPTGPARTNRLVKISLYAILQESFDLYKDISDGLVILLDSFFQLPYQSSVRAFQACVKSSKQFDELTSFYTLCSCIGIGRTSEYPSVQKVSEELLETFQEFLKDEASFPASKNRHSPLPKHFSLPKSRGPSSSYGTPERFFEIRSEIGSQRTSLEDLMSATDAGISPSRSPKTDIYSSEQSDQDEKQSQNGGYASANDSESSQYQTSRSSLEMGSSDDLPEEEKQNQHKNATLGSKNVTRECWEIVLVKTATKPELNSPELGNVSDPFSVNTLFDQSSASQRQYNPFLEDVATVAPSNPPSQTFSTADNQAHFIDLFDTAPTFQAVPQEICAQYPGEPTMSAPFSAPKSIEPTMEPTFYGQSSGFDSSLALAISDLNPNGAAVVTAFNAQDYAETIKAPTFHAQNPNGSAMAPTFNVQDYAETIKAPTFHAQNPSGSAVAPTFIAQDYAETIKAPSLHAQNPNVLTAAHSAPSFHAQASVSNDPAPIFHARSFNEMSTASNFNAQALAENGWLPSFHGHNANEMSIVPTFRTQNLHRIMTEPTFAAQNPNEICAARTFHPQNSDGGIAAPTFSAKGSNYTTPIEEDPFGPWPREMANQHTSMQEESVFLQQKMWLAQENKIIAKRMT